MFLQKSHSSHLLSAAGAAGKKSRHQRLNQTGASILVHNRPVVQVLDTLVEIGQIDGSTAADARAKFILLHDALAAATTESKALAEQAQQLEKDRVVSDITLVLPCPCCASTCINCRGLPCQLWCTAGVCGITQIQECLAASNNAAQYVNNTVLHDLSPA